MTWEKVPEFPGLSVRLESNQDGRRVITALTLEAAPVTAEMLRKIPMARIENTANADEEDAAAELPPLRREAGTEPDGFARLVADHYRHWARRNPNPVTAMANRWGIKLPTAHTWVREARLRGHLPPARRRKA